MSRHAALNEKLNDVDRFNLRRTDRQALTRELIDHVEHAVFLSIIRAIFEVVGPKVGSIAALRPQAAYMNHPSATNPAFGHRSGAAANEVGRLRGRGNGRV